MIIQIKLMIFLSFRLLSGIASEQSLERFIPKAIRRKKSEVAVLGVVNK